MLAAYYEGMVSVIFYDFLDCIENHYTPIRFLKESDRGSIQLLRHNATGKRFVFRKFSGSTEVYEKLLKVTCPYLPQVYEAAMADGQAAVLEEYIQGDNLAWLLEEMPLTPKEARKILLQLCEGVWVLHSLGAVHRDIKPENVILRGDEAVLIDFDASRIHKPEVDNDTKVMGTTGYAAPEQYGIAQTDARADIYSLGVLLNVMLTREHPSRSLAGGRLGRIVEKCTMTNPKQRYQTVQQLMEALKL